MKWQQINSILPSTLIIIKYLFNSYAIKIYTRTLFKRKTKIKSIDTFAIFFCIEIKNNKNARFAKKKKSRYKEHVAY